MESNEAKILRVKCGKCKKELNVSPEDVNDFESGNEVLVFCGCGHYSLFENQRMVETIISHSQPIKFPRY